MEEHMFFSSTACKKGKLLVMAAIYKAMCLVLEESINPALDIEDLLKGIALLTMDMSLDVKEDGPAKIADALGLVVDFAKKTPEMEGLEDGN